MPPLPHNAPPGFDWVMRLESWQLTDNCVHVSAGTAAGRQATLTFAAVSPAMWRMTFLPPGVASLQPTPIVVGNREASISLSVREEAAELVVSGPRLTLHLRIDPWQMSFTDAAGNEVCRENPSDIDGLGRPFILPLGYVMNEARVTHVTESFHLRPDEHLFGLGEKFTPLDKRGQRIISWTQDAFGSTSERSHKNIPFLMSTQGYGLFIDSGARITWELGTVSCQTHSVLVEASSLDAYISLGPTPAELLAAHTELTGRSPLPPRWSFGLWLSGAGTYRDRASHERLVEGLKQHDIPADVLHVDTWWLRWRYYCDFRWDREAFPDVEQWIARLHADGLKITLWEHPYISVESDLFQFGKERGYFVLRPDGEVYVIDYGLSLAPRPDGIVRIATPDTSWNARVAIIDLSHPEAYRWFQDLHRPILKMGVDGFKTDFGEDIPVDAQFSNGQTGATMHNLFPLLYNQAVYEVTQQERGYGIVFSRSGTVGNQRYPVCWSGDPAADFDSLACTIRGGLSIGLSGVAFWTSDIGGYRGLPSARLYIRWAQFAMFCSHSRMHGDSPREPWYFGDEAVEIVRNYVRLRYELFPYLYSLAHEAGQTGLPVIRAMPLAFPDDPNTYDKDLQFMLGESLLVAPIYDAGDDRSVYLPTGMWIDYWTGEAFSGPLNLSVTAPLSTLPLFVRGGAIIPRTLPANRLPLGQVDPLIIEVYPYGSAEFRYRTDEGDTIFTLAADEQGALLTWSGALQRPFQIRFKHFPFPVAPGDLATEVVNVDQSTTVFINEAQLGVFRVGRMNGNATLRR